MTARLRVSSASGAYPILIGAQLLDQAGDLLRDQGLTPGTTMFVVTDDSVAALGYADRLRQSLQTAGFRTAQAQIPPGDASKSLAMADRLYHQLLDAQVRRDGVIIALGGGVVGDLAGFVAATYLRGIRFVQMPTTLLAHDSSVGGKVGVNLDRAKNLVGAIHPPVALIYDISTLRSLPAEQWRGGMAEIIKEAIIGDAPLFAELERSPVTAFPGPEAGWLLERAMSVKIRIVEADEHEAQLRMLLNLGHTIGHAVEQVSRYAISHGDAVSIGLRMESEIACARGWLASTDRDRIVQLLVAHGLPVTAPDMPWSAILSALSLDKKHGPSSWTFVLPFGIGDVRIIRDVAEADVRTAWHTAGGELDQ